MSTLGKLASGFVGKLKPNRVEQRGGAMLGLGRDEEVVLTQTIGFAALASP